MHKFYIKKNNLFLCFILIAETILIKFLQYRILPEKYFYDSEKILSIMNGSNITDKGFSFTANFFNTINVFHFNNIQQWSIFISVIFLMVFIIFFLKKELNIINFIFILSSFALLNIYVFNLSKDIIQLVFFLIIYLICSNCKLSDNKKIILSSCVFIFESLFFRTYYLIIAVLIMGIYFIYNFLIESKKNSKKRTSIILLFSFALFMLMIYILQMVSSENYMILINARNNNNLYRDTTDAVTMIKDILPNTNYLNFIINYFINTFRILFPVELFLKGIKYIPFIIYQFFISFIIFKNTFKIKNEKFIYLIMCMAFIMVSIIYEPDFGSVIRHESVLFLFIIKIIDKERMIIAYDEEKSISDNTDI